MARLLWLADVLRDAGLTVHEVVGWEKRGDDNYGPVRGITCHATAGSRNSTDSGELHTILHGSETAPPPIAQLYLSRTGAWHVVASGTCFHNKVGWAGPNKGFGNDALLGIEAQHSNTSAEPWTERQYDSYVRGVAALVRKLGIPVARVAGHKEHQPAPPPPGQKSTKTDPTFDMGKFRAAVTAVLDGKTEVPDMTPQQAQQLRDAHYTTSVAIPNPTGEGRVPLHVWAGWMTVAVKTLLAKDDVELDADDLAQVQEAARAGAAASAEAIVAGVLAGLPEGTLTRDDVESAVRQVLLTGAGPQG